MRDFLDAILNFIVTTSLTDAEFETVESTITIYDQSTYDDLARILIAREAVSVLKDRLVAYYKARGVDVTPINSGSSNIFIGGALCE